MSAIPLSEPEEDAPLNTQRVREGHRRRGQRVLMHSARSSGNTAKGSGCLCTPCPLIDPRNSCWLKYWDLCLTTLIALTAFVTPFDATFLTMVPATPVGAWRNLSLDLFFILDVALQFFIIPLDRHQMQVKNRRGIAEQYLRGGFWVDAVSVLPSDLYLLAGFPPGAYKYVSFARLLRLARICRVTERWQQQLGITFTIISLVRFCCLLTMCSHWSACAWGYLAINATNMADDHNWLDALKTAKGGPDELYSDPISIYVLSIYWAVVSTTSIGYGDITPQNSAEYVVALFSIVLLGLLWAYVIGEVCSIMSNLQPHVINYRRTMDSLNHLMNEHDMPGALRCRLREYFHRAQNVNRQRAQKTLISQMSPQLQGEVQSWINHTWLSSVSYLSTLSKCDSRAVSTIVGRAIAQVFPPGELVSKQRTLFVLRRGLCSRKGRVLSAGAVWGEDMLLSNSRLRENYPVNTLTYCDMVMLHVDHVLAAAANNTALRAPLMWARAKFGLCRAIVLIKRALRSLEPDGRRVFNELSSDDRGRAYHAILHGEFTPAWLDDCLCRSKKDPPKPFLEAEPSIDSAMQAIEGLSSVVEQLTSSQAQLADQVANISTKMAELSLHVCSAQ